MEKTTRPEYMSFTTLWTTGEERNALDFVVTASWSECEVLLKVHGASAYFKGALGIVRVMSWAQGLPNLLDDIGRGPGERIPTGGQHCTLNLGDCYRNHGEHDHS